MDKLRLNICSLGDPADPKTWSGTPYHIYAELLKMDRLGAAFNSMAIKPTSFDKLVSMMSFVYYYNSADLKRGAFHRYLNANRVIKHTRRSISKHTLHTGTLDLPFRKLPHDQKHYLFCDSTWNLWSSHATNMNGYSVKLIKEAEKLEQEAYQQMEHIFPISEYVKGNLEEHYGVDPRKITVVGTGLGIIKPFFGKKDYTNGKILFAAKGRFEDKGGSLVLEAFKRVNRINRQLKLTIVGQNNYSRLASTPHIKAHGFVSNDELQQIFNSHSLFLMPALNEPWGLVYLEALACKMPIVGLNRNAFPEISNYGKYGFGLDSTNPWKLADIIIRAFGDPQAMEKMGHEGQAWCLNRFSWSNTVSRIVQVIQQEEYEKIHYHNQHISADASR